MIGNIKEIIVKDSLNQGDINRFEYKEKLRDCTHRWILYPKLMIVQLGKKQANPKKRTLRYVTGMSERCQQHRKIICKGYIFEKISRTHHELI